MQIYKLSMYLHDPQVDLPCPSAEDPPVEFLRSGAENPLSDLPRPGAEQIVFYREEKIFCARARSIHLRIYRARARNRFSSLYREELRSGAENPPSDLPRPGTEQIFFSI